MKFVGKPQPLSVLGAALLMAGCVSQQTYDQSQQQLAASQQQLAASQKKNAELEAEYAQLQQQIASHNEHISRLQDAIKISLDSELLFKSGGYEISSDGKTEISKIAAILAPHQASKIKVVGYTDNTPVSARLAKHGVADNDELSKRRANAVMEFMISQGVKPELISAEGRGEADPVASNDTAAGRAQNRRVEVNVEKHNE